MSLIKRIFGARATEPVKMPQNPDRLECNKPLEEMTKESTMSHDPYACFRDPIKVLLVEDLDKHANSTDFQDDITITRVKSYLQAIAHLYGRGEYGFRDRNCRNPLGYNAVLTDLNLPMQDPENAVSMSEIVGCDNVRLQSGESLQTQNAYGWQIVEAAVDVGIPLVGLLTDNNHHEGLVAATFDVINPNVKIREKSRVALWDIRDWMVLKEDENQSFHAGNREGNKNYATLIKYLRDPSRYELAR